MKPHCLLFARAAGLYGILFSVTGLAQAAQSVLEPDFGSDNLNWATEIFEPGASEYAALSPDGRYLAFSERDGEKMFVSFVDLDQPGKILGKTIVGTAMTATPYLQIRRKERTPVRIAWMSWITPEVLLLETNQRFSRRGGAIVKLEVNAWQGSLVADPSSLIRIGNGRVLRGSAPLHVLDLDPDSIEQVFLKYGYDHDFDLFSLNAVTGKLRFVRRELAIPGREVLFDRQHRARVVVPSTSLAGLPLIYQTMGDLTLDLSLPFHLSPDNFPGTRAIPAGFNEEADRLFFATNQDRDTFAIRALDLTTGEASDFFLADDNYDLISPVTSLFPNEDVLVYDRFTRAFEGVRYAAAHITAKWIDEELEDLQSNLESLLPDRSVEILEWDAARERFLIRTYGPADRGSLRVVDLSDGVPTELIRVVDRREDPEPRSSMDFSYELPGGGWISGLLTIPAGVRQDRPPVIVRYPSGPWERVDPRYDPRRVYLAAMGYAVVDFSGRGAAGFGKEHAQRIQDGFEIQQAEDVVHLLDQLGEDFTIDSSNVVLIGEYFGGYGAMRAAQLYPDRFQAVVAVNPPLDPLDWLVRERWSFPPIRRDGITALLLDQYFADPATMTFLSLQDHPDQIGVPVLFFADREDNSLFIYHALFNASRRIRSAGGTAKLVELHPDYMRRLPEATADVYDQITKFLDETLVEPARPVQADPSRSWQVAQGSAVQTDDPDSE